MKAEISVVIPTYNRAHYLGEALESAWAQSLRPLEVIVGDDGSTDGTETLVKQFKPEVRYFRRDHMGISAALNTGLREVRGTLVAFLDSDDLWLPGKLEKQAQALEKHPDAQMIFAHYEEFLSPECAPQPAPPQDTGADKKCYPGVCSSTLLARRGVFERAGFFDEQLHFGEFIEWYERAQAAGFHHVLLNEVLLKRRIHPGNKTRSDGKPLKQYAQLVRAILDRRRASNAGGDPRV